MAGGLADDSRCFPLLSDDLVGEPGGGRGDGAEGAGSLTPESGEAARELLVDFTREMRGCEADADDQSAVSS